MIEYFLALLVACLFSSSASCTKVSSLHDCDISCKSTTVYCTGMNFVSNYTDVVHCIGMNHFNVCVTTNHFVFCMSMANDCFNVFDTTNNLVLCMSMATNDS